MRIAIVGGGATGALAAAHLARRARESTDIVVIEPAERLGRGLAYSTDDPRHLLNVRASNMSAFGDDAAHFLNWLRGRNDGALAEPFSFVSRKVYGDYVSDVADEALQSGRIKHLRDVCVGASEGPSFALLRLASGATLGADRVVLATGHDGKPTIAGVAAQQPWDPESLNGLSRDAPLLIVGAGLTMVDMALSLDRRGYKGLITAVSRRGLLPSAHRQVAPRTLAGGDTPFGAELSSLLRWLRNFAGECAAGGGDWRSAIDALRPHTQRLWRAMTPEQRGRFLRHARAYWDVHRHRMAPEVEKRLGALRRSGRLRVVAGRVLYATDLGDRISATLRLRGSSEPTTIDVARVIDCTGMSDAPVQPRNRLICSLLDSGLARLDPLGIGLDVAQDFSLVDVKGAPSPRIKVVGPLARAAFWECVAIPDIRLQAQELAERLIRSPQLRPALSAAAE
jgi:uncharacterized NAD(P)/FAD-binding protein YdhS